MIPRYETYRSTSQRDYPITRRKAESIMHDYFPAARHIHSYSILAIRY